MRQTLDAFVAGMPAYLATPARVLLILVLAGLALRIAQRGQTFQRPIQIPTQRLQIAQR